MPKGQFPLQSGLVIDPGPREVEIQQFQQLVKLVEREKDFWIEFQRRYEGAVHGQMPANFNIGWQLLENAMAAGDAGFTQVANSYARSAVNAYNKGLCFLRGSELAEELMRRINKGEYMAAQEIVSRVGGQQNELILPHPSLSALEHLAESPAELVDWIKEIRKQAKNLAPIVSTLESHAGKFNDLETQRDNLQTDLSNCQKKIENINERAESAIKDVLVNANAKASLPRPAAFWQSREERYSQTRSDSLAIFLATIIAVICGLYFFWTPISDKLNPIFMMKDANASGAYLAALFYVGLPTFLLLWVLRLSFRSYVLNRELAIDAGERVVMMKTYIELAEGGHVGRDDLHLALKALFRARTETSTDDAPPTLVDAISDRLRMAPK